MKRLSLISLTLVVASAGSVSSWAGRALPSNDFFTDGQRWEIERVEANNSSQAATLEVRVDGTVMAEGSYTDKYGTYTISEQCARLVVSENGVQTGEFAAVEIYGKILLYSEKKSMFVPVLDFTCAEGDKVGLGDEECNVTRVNYIYPGDILRKKVSGYIGDRTGEYVFGFGAKEFSLSPDYWDGASTYRTVSMTAANGVTLTDNIFGQAPAETSNEYWTEGKSWSYRHFYPSSPEMPDYYTYKTVKGDTEVDHLACRKLFVCDETWKPVYSDYTAVCDIEDQVYQYSDAHQRFILWLDFNIGVGTEAIPGMESTEVVAENRVQAHGRVFDRIVFAGAEDDSEWAYWVKGVGASGPNDIANMPVPPDGSTYRLDACYEDGQKIFSFSDFSLPAYYVPMIRQDRVWEYHLARPYYPDHYYYSMQFEGTISVSGKTYHAFAMKKSIHVGDCDDHASQTEETFTDNGIKYFVREEEGKVFTLFSKTGDESGEVYSTTLPVSQIQFTEQEEATLYEIKMYDAMAPNGAVLEIPDIMGGEVLDNQTESMQQFYGETLDIQGENCRVIGYYFPDPEGGNEYPTLSGDHGLFGWIEGIGVLRQGCLPVYQVKMKTGAPAKLYSDVQSEDTWLHGVYTLAGEVLFGEPPYGVGILTISEDASPADNRMFDLMGREITAPVSGTVYIRDGKKLVAK